MAENIVPLLCRFGGRFIRQSGDVRYEGGKNRIIHVDRAINFSNLSSKVHETCMSSVVNSIKYKHPDLGLDTLVSIESDEDVYCMMQVFPQDSQLIHLFISCNFSTAVVTPRKPDNFVPLKASLNDINGSNNAFIHLPKSGTLVDMDLQQSENDVFERRHTLSDYQESSGEVVDDNYREDQIANLSVGDSHKAFREHAKFGNSKFKEKSSGSFHNANKLTPQVKSFKANRNNKCEKAVAKHLEDCGTSAIDLKKGQRRKPSHYMMKHYHGETVHEIKKCCDRNWGGKELASGTDHFDNSIMNILAYCEERCKSHPGSVLYPSQSSDGSLRVFLAYNDMIHGFIQACRQLLMLKSFPISGKYPCTWLLALGFDANNNAFPFACAIVNLNYQENWAWFCVELARILDTECTMTFVWDRLERHLQAINDFFPKSYSRYFRESLIDDFSEKFGHLDLDLVHLFHQATYAYTGSEFNDLMSKIKEISSDAREWIDRLEPKLWARSHLEGEDYFGYDDFQWEFDKWICNAQDLPFISMLERFHVFKMNLFHGRLGERSKWKTTMTPFVEEYRFKEDLIMEYYVRPCSETIFFVRWKCEQTEQTVNLQQKRCTCCEWQVRKIPCSHALAVIQIYGLNAVDYCDMCYAVSKYEEAYSGAIYPLSKDIRAQSLIISNGIT